MRILNLPVDVGESSGEFDSKANGHHKSESKNENAKGNHKIKQTSKYAESSFLALGQVAIAGAMLLLISTAPNLIAKATVGFCSW
jgi:hypothetical protein